MDGAEKLLGDYNDYRFRTNHIQQLRREGKHIHSLSAKRLPIFQELHDWCVERGIEPRHWLCSLFESRRWLFAPPLHQLKSKKHLKRYPDIEDMPAYQNRLNQERLIYLHAAGKTFDPNRDITASAEMLKRRYAASGNTDRCMEKMDTEIFGYHPRSETCRQCPARFRCADLLQSKVRFDIMALRRGDITAEQAKAVVFYDRGN